MKAVVYEKYGPPDVLEMKEIEKPLPKEDEVLVKIHASSVNSWDWDRLTGRPYLYRLLSGIRKPKLQILGADVAGTVEAIGQKIRHFKVGDEVFGDLSEGNWGGFAEYTCAKENQLIVKPSFIGMKQAAAIPQAGTMALQALREKQNLKGRKVLMNGGGGAVGSFAIQLAKFYGAEVTAVDTGSKFDFMKSLGADHVIDYKKENFTENGVKYDLIVDVVANQGIYDYKRALSKEGSYVLIGGKIPTALQVGLMGLMISKKQGKKIGILGIKTNQGLSDIIKLIESGNLKVVIDKSFPLKNAAEAIRYLGEGHVKGKVVITNQHSLS